jgi:hypothetical protein
MVPRKNVKNLISTEIFIFRYRRKSLSHRFDIGGSPPGDDGFCWFVVSRRFLLFGMLFPACSIQKMLI